MQVGIDAGMQPKRHSHQYHRRSTFSNQIFENITLYLFELQLHKV